MFKVLPIRIQLSLIIVIGTTLFISVLLYVSIGRLGQIQEAAYGDNLRDNLTSVKYVFDNFEKDATQLVTSMANNGQFVDFFKEEDTTLQSVITDSLMQKGFHHLGFVAWVEEEGSWKWSRAHVFDRELSDKNINLQNLLKPLVTEFDRSGDSNLRRSRYLLLPTDFLTNELIDGPAIRDELALVSFAPIRPWDRVRGYLFLISIVSKNKQLAERLDQILDFEEYEDAPVGGRVVFGAGNFLKFGNQDLFSPKDKSARFTKIDRAYHNLGNSDAKVMIHSDRQALASSIQNQMFWTIVFFIGSAVIFLFALVLLTLRATQSFKDLVQAASQMEKGQYNARMTLRTKGSNELSKLAGSFNRMAVSIEKQVTQMAIQAEREKKLLKSKQELELLQLKNQMRPHFLFNSLNMILSLIEFDSKTAAIMTQQLADLYRLILESSKRTTSLLSHEIEIARLYLEIQRHRFGQRLSFRIDNNCKEPIYLPQLIVQTLVENAIKHGVEKTIDKSYVHIKVEPHTHQKKYKLSVTNNGRLKDGWSPNTGLRNTINILQHLYGELSQFRIFQKSDNEVATVFYFSGDAL